MTRYVLSRLVAAIPVLFLVSSITFLIVHLTPGDPARVMLGPEARPEDVQALRGQLGLDEPLGVQYATFMGQVVRGDFGNSIVYRQPVVRLVLERLPVTLLLTFSALLLGVAASLPLGIVAALKRGTVGDLATMLLALLGISAPSFWVALILIFIFAYRLQLLPATDLPPLSEGGLETVRHLILPATTLALASAALSARVLRASMLEVLGRDYMRTARAKGVSGLGVVLRHGLRNALIPFVTVTGLQFGTLIGGAVVTETVFALPGVGRLAVDAIQARDFPVVQGIVLLVAFSVVAINILVDLVYGALDPRVSFVAATA